MLPQAKENLSLGMNEPIRHSAIAQSFNPLWFLFFRGDCVGLFERSCPPTAVLEDFK
jgi:hypothetical protein